MKTTQIYSLRVLEFRSQNEAKGGSRHVMGGDGSFWRLQARIWFSSLPASRCWHASASWLMAASLQFLLSSFHGFLPSV